MVDLKTVAENTCNSLIKWILKMFWRYVICGFYWPESLNVAIVYFPLMFIEQSFSYYIFKHKRVTVKVSQVTRPKPHSWNNKSKKLDPLCVRQCSLHTDWLTVTGHWYILGNCKWSNLAENEKKNNPDFYSNNTNALWPTYVFVYDYSLPHFPLWHNYVLFEITIYFHFKSLSIWYHWYWRLFKL